MKAKYEFKCSCRNILFVIFIITAIAGLIIYQFVPLLGKDGINSINGSLQLSMNWVSQALPSSIAYKTAYYFNFIQLLFAIGFIANDSRKAKLTAMETLHARPLNNSEIVIGNFLGKLFSFTLVNFIVFTISIVINQVFYPDSFSLPIYLFYWATLNLPALVYFLGISCLVTHFVRKQGLNILILLTFFGLVTYSGTGWLNTLFDPCAQHIPNMFSDFTGHVNLGNYLLQRSSILLVGVGFLILSIIPYPRIPNYPRTPRNSLIVACCILIFAGGLSLQYRSLHKVTANQRETYRQVYEKYSKYPGIKIIHNDLHVRETEDGGISVNSRMDITNKATDSIPLIIYLNPRLKVSSIEIDRQTVPFTREHQALIVNKKLYPKETVEVSINYEGSIDNDICFLDTDLERCYSRGINTIEIYHFGYSPAFCKKGYKLLTPECIWYPTCVPPYEKSGLRGVNFSGYTLKVEHAPRLTAISQGHPIKEREGETTFTFNHDMPGISLCIGNYRELEIIADSVRMALYHLPRHGYLLEEYDNLSEENAEERLTQLKKVEIESEECIRTAEFKRKFLYNEKNDYDPAQEYPYLWLSLVETPCNFHSFPNLMQLTGERVQGGIVFIPEKAYSIKNYPIDLAELAEFALGKENEAIYKLENEVKMITRDQCDIRPMFAGKTTYISSKEYPIIHDVLANMAKGSRQTNKYQPTDEYPAIQYLSHNSLKDALNDKELSPGVLKNIIHKKSDELQTYISLRVEEEEFRKFYLEFTRNHLFQETTFEEFSRQFRQTFGFQLDSLIKNWYNNNQLPLFDIQDAWIAGDSLEVNGLFKRYKYYLYHFKVFNRGNVPGLIRTGKNNGWIIPPHEGREIKAYLPWDEGMICYLQMPLSQNIPSIIEIKEKSTKAHEDMTSSIFKVDSSFFLPNENEIIVDNEDPGFRVVKIENFITSLFHKDENSKKYYEFFHEDKWLPTIDQKFYGCPIQSAFYKSSTRAGKQKVEWSVSLPQEGKFEVFFYFVEHFPWGDPKMEHTRLYTVFDGQKEHEVIATLSKEQDESWVSLGVFDFSKNAKVTLSDKNLNTENHQGIVADAVKWIKTKE